MITNRESVRTFLKNAKDGYSFTNLELAKHLKVKHKDVANYTAILLANGALLKKKIPNSMEFKFTVLGNSMALYLAKFYNETSKDGKEEPMKRSKARSSLTIAIDEEVKILEAKIKRLKQIRREFV